MDFTSYTAAKNNFIGNPNLCELFKLISIETWKRLEYAYLKPGVKVFETTLTQNLIFTINTFNDQYGLNISIFEALDEKRNGNDFELIIKFPNDGIEFYAPIQAKKLYKNGKYTSLDHGNQIVSLINYANERQAIPFYLLFNYSNELRINHIGFNNPFELHGCSIIEAKYLFDNFYNKKNRKSKGINFLGWEIPGFLELNPSPAFPWHELVCVKSAEDLLNKLYYPRISRKPNLKEIIGNLTIEPNGFYPINTFSEGKDWININDYLKLDKKSRADYIALENEYVESDYNIVESNKTIIKYDDREIIYPDFAPRSRIIIEKF